MGGYNSLPIQSGRNPYLDEIDAAAQNAHAQLSPGAQMALKKAGAPVGMTGAAPEAAPQITNPRQPIPLPKGMSPDTISGPDSGFTGAGPMTPISSPARAPQPQVVPPTAAAGPAAAEVARLTAPPPSDPNLVHTHANTGTAGVNQIHNPWARIPLQILGAVGETFAPRLAAALPGTESHHQMLVHEAEGALKQQQGIRKAEEEAQTEAAKTAQEGAQGHLQEATAEDIEREGKLPSSRQYVKVGKDGLYDALHKVWIREPTDAEEGGTVHEEKGGNLVVVHPSGKATLVTLNGQAVQGEPKAGNEAETPLTDQEIAQYNKQLADRYGILNKGQVPPEFQLAAGAKQKNYNAVHQALQQLEQGTQSNLSHQDAMTMARMNFNATQENRRNEDFIRSFDRLHTQLNAELSPVNTQLENIQEARRLVSGGAVGQALGTVKSLVAVAGGRGSGVRVTQPELNSIPAARGLPGGFDQLVNNIMGSGKLTGETQKQLDQVLGQVEEIASRKQALVNGAMDRAAAAKTPDELHKIETDYRHQVQATTQPGGGANTVHYREGNTDYDIPADKVKRFESLHPNAKKQ